MKDIYTKLIAEHKPYSGRNLVMLNLSTLRQRCITAYWNYIDDSCEVTAKGGFKHKNNMLRFLREALPSTSVTATPEELKAMLDEAVTAYLKSGDVFLQEHQLIQLGTAVQGMVTGMDYAVAKKLSFKPHLDRHAGLTAFVMQSDLFVMDDKGTGILKVVQSEGDPVMDDRYEALLALLMQHIVFHPDQAGYTLMYAAYTPAKTMTDVLLKTDLVEPPEVTVNRIINVMLGGTPLCETCRYTNCTERKKNEH